MPESEEERAERKERAAQQAQSIREITQSAEKQAGEGNFSLALTLYQAARKVFEVSEELQHSYSTEHFDIKYLLPDRIALLKVIVSGQKHRDAEAREERRKKQQQSTQATDTKAN